MEEQKANLVFFLKTTNILKINYDRETNSTYIYILENKGGTNADLVVYEFDINTVMDISEDPIGSVEELLEELYFENYDTLERISNKTKIGIFNDEEFKKFLSFNSIYEIYNMTEVSKRIYENCIERVMVRADDINSDYFLNIIESIEKDKGFDVTNRTVDIDMIEKNTIFKRISKDDFKEILDERMILSDDFIDDLLIHEEEEIFISYKYFCEILFKGINDIIMTEK